MFRNLLALVLPFTLLAAQGAPPLPRERGQRGGLWREEIMARLHKMRMERLQQSLGVSEEKARAIADRWAAFDLDSRGNRLRMRRLHQQVNGILMSPLSENEKNARIRPLVDQFQALRQQQQELKRKFEDEIRATLTPAQQGRFLLVVEEIQRAIIEAIRQQRSGGGEPWVEE
jgi:hypothetical protein